MMDNFQWKGEKEVLIQGDRYVGQFASEKMDAYRKEHTCQPISNRRLIANRKGCTLVNFLFLRLKSWCN